jgi:GST-like protein
MNDMKSYTPPTVWQWEEETESKFAKINRPVAGPTHDEILPVGTHPLQLYSLGTPNGVKVTILLEELLAIGKTGAEYDAWFIDIGEGDQFGSGFVDINPNSKIPALVDHSTTPQTPIFESGAIMLYLAEKFDAFVPLHGPQRAECLSWLFWQIGSAPFLGGGFGHFYAYAAEKLEYPINRYAMEIKRQLDVLDRTLASRRYIGGDDYTIADMAIYSWYGQLVLTGLYESKEFLDVAAYANVVRWATEIHHRPAVRRGRKVNRSGESGVKERHDASDLDALDTT